MGRNDTSSPTKIQKRVKKENSNPNGDRGFDNINGADFRCGAV